MTILLDFNTNFKQDISPTAGNKIHTINSDNGTR